MKQSLMWIIPCALSLAAIPALSQAPATPALPSSSAQLRSSLYSVQSTLASLNIQKWKHGSIRDEAADDVQAIQHEIRVTLPPLLVASDAAPESLGKALAVVKRVGAVYDVLLRVFDAARISAPAEQVGELQVALRSLERARLSLDDRLQTEATRQEQQMSALRVTLQKQAAFKCPAPPPVKPCPKPRVHHYTRRRHATKPAEKKTTDSATKPKTNP
ncbi:MAG: hypothetical protein WBD67_02195 [Terracidiphilus sp.]